MQFQWMNELKQFLAGEFEWGSVDNVKRIFEVNVFGVIRVTKAFLPLIRKSKGRIVNLASVAGRLTGIGNLLIFFKWSFILCIFLRSLNLLNDKAFNYCAFRFFETWNGQMVSESDYNWTSSIQVSSFAMNIIINKYYE